MRQMLGPTEPGSGETPCCTRRPGAHVGAAVGSDVVKLAVGLAARLAVGLDVGWAVGRAVVGSMAVGMPPELGGSRDARSGMQSGGRDELMV